MDALIEANESRAIPPQDDSSLVAFSLTGKTGFVLNAGAGGPDVICGRFQVRGP